MSKLTSNSNVQYAIEVNSCEEQQFAMAFLHLYDDGKFTTEKLSHFVHSCYVNILKTREFCAAVVEQNGKAIVAECFHDLTRVFRQQLLMLETLQFFHNSSDQNLDRINACKNFSFVFFTIAAAITAAVGAANAGHKRPAMAAAAAAASIVWSALGNWTHSLLKKDESAVKKHKEIISVMIMWTQIAIKDLIKIHAVARRLQFLTESMSEMVDGGGAMEAAVTVSIEELQGKDREYSRDMRCATKSVLQSITNNTQIN